MYSNRKIMTVKIQQSIFGSRSPSVLIYNQSRSYIREMPLDKAFRKLMGKSLKKYFKVMLEDDKLCIIEPVNGLDW